MIRFLFAIVQELLVRRVAVYSTTFAWALVVLFAVMP